ncbi:RNA-binding cell elongation regulator Jag/EloR [Candidatus Desulforudis audaxviator]|uniref:RNA-binding protein KhpB n=1 Tax=Desulforudis audaxviator (strain MP104C) TaxID=477974 RepID=B1I6S3_DESAP|nr:RNA-binding cell elongation regulator Jag/EloR [Candidatus Desulforudis audaxviator]ACA60721.1 single-stranded nucleic acid binding R3H domain protein [Candidatus Desulforudis audaxviator MP104C]
MKAVEGSGRSVEEAAEEALKQLGVPRDRVEIEVLEEPSRGFLGLLGSRPARVRVVLKETVSDRARDFLEQVVAAMGVQADIVVEETDEEISVGLEGKHLGILIGRRGETLNALQYLLNLSANKDQAERKKIILDVEGYRKKREDTLVKLATKLAEKAKRRGRSVVLEPMNSQERRIIHTTLRGRDDIYTFSEGEEPFRKIIIAPRK